MKTSKIKQATYVFDPWTDDGEKRIKASEEHWRHPRGLDSDAAIASSECPRPQVFVGASCDWAEDWQGPIVDSNGRRILSTGSGYCVEATDATIIPTPTIIEDLQRDLLDLACECSNLDWMFLTKRPERVPTILRDWSDGRETLFDRDSQDPDIPDHWQFGCSVSDQDTADRAEKGTKEIQFFVPQCKTFVLIDNLRGPIDLTRMLGSLLPSEHELSNWPIDGVARVIVGEQNATPHTAEWIADIVRQCKVAGVECVEYQETP